MAKYVIIGAGSAGISALEAIRSQDQSSDITVICEEKAGYYSRPGLAYYLTGEITEDCLYPFQTEDFNRLRVNMLKAQAHKISPHEHMVELNDGNCIHYDRLLIATGARAAEARIPGVELEGVIKLDNMEDARRILKLAHRRSTAVVVGGGITALELVEGFRARGVKVHYLLRGDRYWSNVLDETESRIIEHRLKEEGIQIHYHTELKEIIGKRGKVEGVITTEGKKINCDIVAVAIGVLPKKTIAETAGITCDRGISVDEYLGTSEAGIYAAGDVAQVYDPTSGKAILDSLWGPARKQGYTAGLNMAGKNVPYIKTVAFNVTRLAGLTTTIIGALGGRGDDADTIGIVRGESEGWRQMPDAIAAQSGFNVNRLRILVGENRIVGALVMGDQTLSRAIHHIITEKIDIEPIRLKIHDSRLSITDTIADFWGELNSPGRQKAYVSVKS